MPTTKPRKNYTELSKEQLTLPEWQWLDFLCCNIAGFSTSLRQWLEDWEIIEPTLGRLNQDQKRYMRWGHYWGWRVGRNRK